MKRWQWFQLNRNLLRHFRSLFGQCRMIEFLPHNEREKEREKKKEEWQKKNRQKFSCLYVIMSTLADCLFDSWMRKMKRFFIIWSAGSVRFGLCSTSHFYFRISSWLPHMHRVHGRSLHNSHTCWRPLDTSIFTITTYTPEHYYLFMPFLNLYTAVCATRATECVMQQFNEPRKIMPSTC